MSPDTSHTKAVNPQLSQRRPQNITASQRSTEPSMDLADRHPVHAVHASFAALAPMQTAWDDLAGRDGDLFGSFDWCRIWWQHYGHGRQLEIHALHAAGRLVGVLPLFRETLPLGGAFLRVVRLVGCDHTLDAAGLAIEPTYADVFLQHVLDTLDERGAWDLLHFGPLRNYMTVSEPIRNAAARHPRVQAVIHGVCDNWITQFDLPATYDDYLAGLQRMDRRNLTRRERNLQTEHEARFVTARGDDQVRSSMDALVALHKQLWVGKGHQGVFGDWPAYESFHRELAQCFARRDQLALVRIDAAGQPIAATYGYHFGPRTHTMITGYIDEPPWRSFGMGRLLHSLITRESITHGAAAMDDGRGVFEHKLRFGGTLQGERSVAILRKGASCRFRFWLALRAAYLQHVLYCRLWFDRLAPRLGRRRPLRHAYIRSSFLAQLFRRVRFGLFRGPAVYEAQHLPLPPQAPASPPAAPADQIS